MCRAVAWAIIDDGHQFFSQRLHPNDFNKRRIPFPTSLLDDVISDITYGRSPFRISFPERWTQVASRPPYQRPDGGGGYGGQGRPPARPGAPYNQDHGGGYGGGRGPNNGRQGGPNNQGAGNEYRVAGDGIGHVASGIRNVMKAYYTKFNGRISVRQICQYANKTLRQLPYINKYMVNGRNMLCYNHVLGSCSHGQSCGFNHVPGRELPADFISKLCTEIKPGVDHLVRNGGP